MNIAGFDSVETALEGRPCVRMSVEGLEKTGKTSFCLTAPRPLAYVDFDFGLHGVANILKGADNVAIKTIDIGPLDDLDPAEALKLWNDFLVGYDAALKVARTVVFDSGTAAWELLRMTRFGKLAQVQPHHYAPVNQEMEGLVKKAFTAGVNLLVTHSVKEEWSGNSPTGNLIRDGYKRMGYAVDTVLSTYREPTEDGVEFGMMVRDCRQNAQMIGQHIPQAALSFKNVIQMVYPGVKAKEWGDYV